MSDKLSELEPCRWCKGTKAKVLDFAESAIHVACPCGVQMFGGRAHFGSREEAIAAWNRRPSPAPAIPAVDPVAIHDAALEAAATAVEAHDRDGREWINGSLWDTLTREACARIRALKAAPAISESDRIDAERYRAHLRHEYDNLYLPSAKKKHLTPLTFESYCVSANQVADAARKGEKS